MSAGVRPPHAVLLRDPAFDFNLVAAALAARSQLTAENWMPALRKNWGILLEPSAAEEAEAVAEALTKAGHAAVAVPVGLLDEPPASVFAAKAELSREGFDSDAAERLPWSRLKVLSAGTMGEKSGSFIELIFAEPARRVRIAAANFDYSALDEKMSYSAELNFRALVAELAARAPAALRGKGARAVLAKAPSGALAYESFEELEREERWLLALAVLSAALPQT